MAKRFRVLRGLAANIPVLLEGELGYTTDSKCLFIGSATGNIELGKLVDILSAIAVKANKTNVLEKDNVTVFTPTADYHPATKKFVNDLFTAFSIAASSVTSAANGNLSSTNVQAALVELQGDIDTLGSGKADKSNVLTKDNVTVFTPTLSYHPATKAFVDAAIANLLNSAPAALDTLNEIATAMGNDPNFATTMTNALAAKLATATFDTHNADGVRHITAGERTAWNNKVDVVGGKGLSTNDYTTAEKNKLAAAVNYDDTAIKARATALEAGYDCGLFTEI